MILRCSLPRNSKLMPISQFTLMLKIILGNAFTRLGSFAKSQFVYFVAKKNSLWVCPRVNRFVSRGYCCSIEQAKGGFEHLNQILSWSSDVLSDVPLYFQKIACSERGQYLSFELTRTISGYLKTRLSSSHGSCAMLNKQTWEIAIRPIEHKEITTSLEKETE